MTTAIKNLFFPIPDNHSNTLHGFGVNESYQMGTLSMVPTMTPIPPPRPGGRTMGEQKADETLEELEESIEYLECTKKCKRKRRHGATRTPMEMARLQDTAHGAHHDLLYKGTAARGGSLHGGVLRSRSHALQEFARQRAHQRGRQQGKQEGIQQGVDYQRSRQKAKDLNRGQKAAYTKQLRRKELEERLRELDPSLPDYLIKDYTLKYLKEQVKNREEGHFDEMEARARDATAHAEGKGTATGGTFSGDPDNRRPPGGLDGHRQSAPRRDFVDGDE